MHADDLIIISRSKIGLQNCLKKNESEKKPSNVFLDDFPDVYCMNLTIPQLKKPT